jgi:uncharacterized protein YdhG (YjbR/CyaY superfamily)
MAIPLANSGDMMPTTRGKSGNIDEYIARFSPDVRAILQKVRKTIHKAAPAAEETISYQIPAFTLNGILVYFAAFKEHIGLYPPVAGDAALMKAIARYAGEKGNLQFPLDQPIPYALIDRIVRVRATQNLAKGAKLAKARRSGKATRAGKSAKRS